MNINILRFNLYIISRGVDPADFWDGNIKQKFSKLEKEVIKAKSFKNYDNILKKYNLI